MLSGGGRVREGAHLAARLLVGSVLLATAVGKALDVGGFVAVIESYELVTGALASLAALFFINAEGALAGALLLGRGARPAAWGSVALHVGLGLVATLTLLRGIAVPNCGCFGVFLARPLTWSTPFEDLGMALVSLICALTWRRKP